LLGQIATVRRGITYSEAALRDSPEDGLPYINMKSFLKDGGYNRQGLKYYAGFYTSSDISKEFDLLIANTDVTRNGDIIGVPALLPDELLSEGVLFSHHVTKLGVSSKLNIEYLYYLLCSDSCRRSMKRYARGTTVLMLDMNGIKRIRINYPESHDEQGKAVSILKSIDSAIAKTENLITKYLQIKAGMMHDLFTRGVLPNGQLRPPRSEAPEMYQEAAIGWVPQEWEVSGLSGKGRAGVGWIRTGPFGSALKGEHWRTHGCPVITIGALGEGEFTHEELLFVGEKDAARLRDFQLKSGDVVFSRVADVGRSAVIREDQVGWIMSSNLMRIAIDEHQARPDFLQMALAGDARVKAQIRAHVNSGGRDVANSKVLSKLRFIWPDLAEQDQIIALSNHASRNLNMERRKSEKLKRQKLGLMQDLLTGKVPVQVNEADAGACM